MELNCTQSFPLCLEIGWHFIFFCIENKEYAIGTALEQVHPAQTLEQGVFNEGVWSLNTPQFSQLVSPTLGSDPVGCGP